MLIAALHIAKEVVLSLLIILGWVNFVLFEADGSTVLIAALHFATEDVLSLLIRLDAVPIAALHLATEGVLRLLISLGWVNFVLFESQLCTLPQQTCSDW